MKEGRGRGRAAERRGRISDFFGKLVFHWTITNGHLQTPVTVTNLTTSPPPFLPLRYSLLSLPSPANDARIHAQVCVCVWEREREWERLGCISCFVFVLDVDIDNVQQSKAKQNAVWTKSYFKCIHLLWFFLTFFWGQNLSVYLSFIL